MTDNRYVSPEIVVTRFEVNRNIMMMTLPETTASPDGPGDIVDREWESPTDVPGGELGDLFE
ncbi:hypothetical protein [uncultured Eubacterium sp.]|uniref:hypothetical protein n=1 Tax=uncultured Eubacterium sp. TaxID=165185 RepID=UPI002671B937|nr:hypothetical protein [uncultured Eubacterium sp.]